MEVDNAVQQNITDIPGTQESDVSTRDSKGRFKPGFSGNPGGTNGVDKVLLGKVKNLALDHILKVMQGDDEKRKDKFAEALIKLMPREVLTELQESQIYVIRKPGD